MRADCVKTAGQPRGNRRQGCWAGAELLAAPVSALASVSPLVVAFSADSTRPPNQPSTRCLAASDLILVSPSQTKHSSNLLRDSSVCARASVAAVTDLYPGQFLM